MGGIAPNKPNESRSLGPGLLHGKKKLVDNWSEKRRFICRQESITLTSNYKSVLILFVDKCSNFEKLKWLELTYAQRMY